MDPWAPLLIFGTSFVVGLSGALMPGPLLAVSISSAARRGFWEGPRLVVGHGLTELAMVVALSWGLSALLGKSLFPALIGIGGGLFLLWMGWGLLRAPGGPLEVAGFSGFSRTPVVAGALVSLANPYWFLWWATVGSSYVLWALGIGLAGVALFYLGHVLSDFSWYSLVSFLVARGRRGISAALHRWLMRSCGGFLVLLGGYFLWSGLKGF